MKRLLQDGKQAYLGLAKELKVPDTTIHFRVKRMREGRVLKGFTAIINPREAGLVDLAIAKLKIARQPDEFVTEGLLEKLAIGVQKTSPGEIFSHLDRIG